MSNKPPPRSVPSEFIKLKRTGALFKCTTLALRNSSVTIKSLVEQILIESSKVLNNFVADNISSFGVLHRLAVTVSLIDALASLAHSSVLNNWTKPAFSHYTKLNQSWHPLLAKIQRQKPVPNDVYLWKGQNLAVISGQSFFDGQDKILLPRRVLGTFLSYNYSRF